MWTGLTLTLQKVEDGYALLDRDHVDMSGIQRIEKDYTEPEFVVEPVCVDPLNEGDDFPKAKTPLCSRWFSPNEIHHIEVRSMPEFFTNKSANKTPQHYIYYRNFIIRSYRESPKEYLTATTCRRSLIGDACTILRLHKFLEKWGLINFEVEPNARPKKLYSANLPAFVGTHEVTVRQSSGKWCGFCGEICSNMWYKHPLICICPSCFS